MSTVADPVTGEPVPKLAQVLADWREDVSVLRRTGHVQEAAMREAMAEQVAKAAAPMLTYLSETNAMLRSGRSQDWFRARFERWEREGLARWNGKKRQYLEIIVPQRAKVTQAHEAGRQAARNQRRAR